MELWTAVCICVNHDTFCEKAKGNQNKTKSNHKKNHKQTIIDISVHDNILVTGQMIQSSEEFLLDIIYRLEK